MGEAAEPLTPIGMAKGWINLRPCKPGEVRNPSGKNSDSKLVQYIRDHTLQGEEISRFMLSVMRGEVDGFGPKLRMIAAAWCADRGFGKAREFITLEGEPRQIGGILERLSNEEIIFLGRIIAKQLPESVQPGRGSGGDSPQEPQ